MRCAVRLHDVGVNTQKGQKRHLNTGGDVGEIFGARAQLEVTLGLKMLLEKLLPLRLEDLNWKIRKITGKDCQSRETEEGFPK